MGYVIKMTKERGEIIYLQSDPSTFSYSFTNNINKATVFTEVKHAREEQHRLRLKDDLMITFKR